MKNNMFLNNSKKVIYLFSSTILGILLSLLAHAFIEMGYLRWAENQNLIVVFYNGCALLPILQIVLLAVGAISGFFMGRFWWQKIYVEKVWRKR